MLSEKEMLLLNCVFYSTRVAQTAVPNTTLGELARDMVEMDSGTLRNTLSGGFSDISRGLDSHLEAFDYFNGPEEYKALLREVIASPTLSDLEIRYPLVDGGATQGLSAACFVEPSGEATVVFRGTDNACHVWDTDAVPRLTAVDYVDKVSAAYGGLAVTGHAKGGNEAMLTTVLRGDQVGRCVSFNDQGFNPTFYEEYENQISANKHKIKSINSSDAGSYAAYLYWDNKFDESGSFVSARANEGRSYGAAVQTEQATPYEPFIHMNTDHMRNYAEQIEEAKRRISTARTELTLLCETNPDMEPLSPILSAYFPAKYEDYLGKCAAYLNGAADAFDKAERDIISKFDN